MITAVGTSCSDFWWKMNGCRDVKGSVVQPASINCMSVQQRVSQSVSLSMYLTQDVCIALSLCLLISLRQLSLTQYVSLSLSGIATNQ